MSITMLYTKIKNERDINDKRLSMAQGNYPLGMTDCEVVGINGDCDMECPVYLRGECLDFEMSVEEILDK